MAIKENWGKIHGNYEYLNYNDDQQTKQESLCDFFHWFQFVKLQTKSTDQETLLVKILIACKVYLNFSFNFRNAVIWDGKLPKDQIVNDYLLGVSIISCFICTAVTNSQKRNTFYVDWVIRRLNNWGF